jgi:hypothetical protein
MLLSGGIRLTAPIHTLKKTLPAAIMNIVGNHNPKKYINRASVFIVHFYFNKKETLSTPAMTNEQ